MTTTGAFYTTTTTTTATETLSIPPTFELVAASLSENFLHYLNKLDNLPGGQIILRYLKSSYKNDPVRSLFEFALFVFACKYFLSSKRKENKADVVRLSNREIDELCQEWQSEPLVENVTDLQAWELKSIPRVKGMNGSHIHLENIQGQVVNLASNDFLNLNESETIHESAKATIRNVGVGACGPPNFYGTQEIHIRLEEDLAEYLDGEQAILYGQDFVTAGSVIPAFLKRGDLCVVDSGVNLAIQKALIVSRCDIEWYEHNNMDHLEEVLTELKPVLDKQKPVKRRFIITEALFANSGDLALLPRLVELKNKFKYRLFVDETLSIGVLGKTGKGLSQHYGIPRSEIAITIGSLALSFASSGGFCVGVKPMVHHQRIQSIAYVFSASLPPYCARTASRAIEEITQNLDLEGNSKLIVNLHEKTSFLYGILSKKLPRFASVISNSASPIIHISLTTQFRKQLSLPEYYGSVQFLNTGKASKHVNQFNHRYNLESFILQKIVDAVLLNSNILITRTKRTFEHENLPVLNPHLMIFVNNGVSIDELSKLAEILNLAIDNVCSKISNEQDLLNLEYEITKY